MNSGGRLHLWAEQQQIAVLALAFCCRYICDCLALGCAVVVQWATSQLGLKLKLCTVNGTKNLRWKRQKPKKAFRLLAPEQWLDGGSLEWWWVGPYSGCLGPLISLFAVSNSAVPFISFCPGFQSDETDVDGSLCSSAFSLVSQQLKVLCGADG